MARTLVDPDHPLPADDPMTAIIEQVVAALNIERENDKPPSQRFVRFHQRGMRLGLAALAMYVREAIESGHPELFGEVMQALCGATTKVVNAGTIEADSAEEADQMARVLIGSGKTPLAH